ncbi:MAG: inositol 2-dehydrogenase [Gammaproteobacteria bacterium]
MLGFALLGAGRIGAMHAANLARHPETRLVSVFDVNEHAAAQAAQDNGAVAAADVHAALGMAGVDAVLIASATDTHVDLIIEASRAGKAVLCEKPIDLDIERVEACKTALEQNNVPVQIGFNRRYDPNHRAVRDAVAAGDVGALELLVITSRDPGLAPVEYLRVSGGLFRDMMIHDFDLARFVLGEEPVEVSAMGSVRVDETVAELGDIDTAMVTLKTANGTLCHINNSRRAVYGYDQRLEAFGSEGMVISDNVNASSVSRYTGAATAVRDPLPNFFIERYAEAYLLEIGDFVAAVEADRTPSVSFEDGRRALLLANAALESLNSGQVVRVAP